MELCGESRRSGRPAEIIALGREIGFDYIQLNTNGIRIARDFHYLQRLKECVDHRLPGIDGVTEEPYFSSAVSAKAF